MADPNDELSPYDEEEGGGPVKTFLEHLEDLRWLLIKSGAALLVCLIICLYMVNDIVWILKRPLQQAALIHTGHGYKAVVQFGTNTLTTLQLETNRVGSLDLGTNWVSIVYAEPVLMGSNVVLSLRVDPSPPKGALERSATDLVYLDPSQPFLSSLHLALYGGFLLAAPIIFYFLAQFILPALRIREKKYVLRACAIGAGLFFAGVAFCYFFVMARALSFAEAFANWMGVKVPEWRAETYFSFVTKFMLGMGLGFELPVVLLALVKIGILDYAKLKAMRRYMIVINLILGALLTTPEVFTQVVMAIVLQILYEISVWIAWYWERRDRAREAAEEATGGRD
jgi:sec-independent protein translocase protein TatC